MASRSRSWWSLFIVLTVAGLGVEPPVFGAVRREQDDRPCALEVRVEHVRLLGRGGRQLVALPVQGAGMPGEPGRDPGDQQGQRTNQDQQQRPSHGITLSFG